MTEEGDSEWIMFQKMDSPMEERQMNDQYEKIQEINNLDQIIHARARLLIISYIYLSGRADFRFLHVQTRLTWGNLSTHMSKLEEAGYVTIKKKIIQKKTYTTAFITKEGKNAFEEYKKQILGIFG